jgi:hypothetical protein
VLSQPLEHLLWAAGGHEDLGRSGKRDPFADVRTERLRLPSAIRPVAILSRMLFPVMLGPGGDKAQPLEDPARLVRGEVGAIEAGSTGEHLLRRETDATNDYVVLMHRVRQAIPQAPFDPGVVEFEVPA